MDIRKAGLEDLEIIVPLFDAYRQFYKQASDLPKARAYLRERLTRSQADIFLCLSEGRADGFTLLYPTFCSVSAAPTFVLYDLFVREPARRKGVGEALLRTAQEHARESGAAWLKLETAVDNTPAQALYEKLGWERETDFFTYNFVPPPAEHA